MKPGRIIHALSVLLLAATAFGQNLTVRATVVGSVRLDVTAAGETTSGAGSVTYTVTIGKLADMQSAPSGFTLVRDAGSATLTSTIDTKVLKANLPNNSYTLTARLQHAAGSGVTWKVNGVELSADAASAVAAGTFGTSDSVELTIDVADAAVSAPLDNAIVFSVVLR